MSDARQHICDRMTCNGCIQVTSGLSGWFAVHMVPDREQGFCEPWQSGIGRYKTSELARMEAKDWAETDEIPFMG